MDPKKLAEAADPRSLGAYLAGLPRPAAHDHGPHGERTETTREAEHRGHRIVIKTTYEITVDGKPLAVPLVLLNNGQLHCHALPNYQFSSAVDLVKQLISTYRAEFPPGEEGHRGRHEHHEHPEG